jgi:hypothetical protein
VSVELAERLQVSYPSVFLQEDRFRVNEIPLDRLYTTLESIRQLLENEPKDAAPFEVPKLAEGWARCNWSKGFEQHLVEGECYEVTEIANMLGHAVVFVPGGLPLVGIHLDRFKMVTTCS